MRRSFLAILATALGVTTSARADSITLTFAALAGQDGRVIAQYTDQGIQLQSSLGFEVIGPSSPYYTGSVGLAPIGASWALIDETGTPLAPATAGALEPYQLAEWIAAAGSSSYGLTVTGFHGTPPAATWEADDSGDLTATPVPALAGGNGPLADIVVTGSLGNYQLTELDINTGDAGGTDPGTLGQGGGGGGGGGTVPEPCTASLALLALAILSLAARATARPRERRAGP